MITSFFRFSLFALYFGLVLFLPLSVLWGSTGFAVALICWVVFLGLLGFGAPFKIIQRLGAEDLTRSKAPFIFHITEELCRRSQIPVPRLWYLNSKVPNIALTGFRKGASHLIVTSEVLQLKRTEQIALVARGVVMIANNDIFNSTWLSQFLYLIETCVGFSKKGLHQRRESDSLRHFLVQTVLYPATMVPIYLLGRTLDAIELDRRSILISKQPLALSEVYRKTESRLKTELFTIPLNCFHLFLAEPKREDVVTSVLFKRRSLERQVQSLNPLRSI